jgi:hypothetical protein
MYDRERYGALLLPTLSLSLSLSLTHTHVDKRDRRQRDGGGWGGEEIDGEGGRVKPLKVVVILH